MLKEVQSSTLYFGEEEQVWYKAKMILGKFGENAGLALPKQTLAEQWWEKCHILPQFVSFNGYSVHHYDLTNFRSWAYLTLRYYTI